MCFVLALALLLALVLVALVVFVKTALFLLPWSLPAAALATLVAVLIGTLARKSERPELALPLSLPTAFLLTLALAYLGCQVVPPEVASSGTRSVLDMPAPSQETLDDHLPVHMTIAALASTAVVAFLFVVVLRAVGVQPRGRESDE